MYNDWKSPGAYRVVDTSLGKDELHTKWEDVRIYGIGSPIYYLVNRNELDLEPAIGLKSKSYSIDEIYYR